MTAAIDTKHLRSVGLGIAEIKTITLLATSGGELAIYLEKMLPLSRQVIDTLVAKQIITVSAPDRGRSIARLTDQGRHIASQLDAMNAAPKVVA